MSMECGCGCIWGICLDPNDAINKNLFTKLNKLADKENISLSHYLDEFDHDDKAKKMIENHLKNKLKIVISPDMEIIAIGDEAPAKMITPPNSILVGYGTCYRDPRDSLLYFLSDSFFEQSSILAFCMGRIIWIINFSLENSLRFSH